MSFISKEHLMVKNAIDKNKVIGGVLLGGIP